LVFLKINSKKHHFLAGRMFPFSVFEVFKKSKNGTSLSVTIFSHLLFSYGKTAQTLKN